MWREREARKKVVIKEDIDIKVETYGMLETVHIKSESSPLKKTVQKGITKVETSPLNRVKEETVGGYHIEHFSSI